MELVKIQCPVCARRAARLDREDDGRLHIHYTTRDMTAAPLRAGRFATRDHDVTLHVDPRHLARAFAERGHLMDMVCRRCGADVPLEVDGPAVLQALTQAERTMSTVRVRAKRRALG